MTPAQRMTLALSAAAIMIGPAVLSEGWKLKAYPDPVHGLKLPTACAGVTKGVVLGKTYSEAECMRMTMLAAVEHAAPVLDCAPDDFLTSFKGDHAKYVSRHGDTAFNTGVAGFHASSMCKRWKARDYAGACDALLLYKYAGGKDCSVRANNCYGVWTRRQEQRKLCLEAINP